MSTADRSPPVAPKPKPKPRSIKSPTNDADRPHPRPRLGTQLPGMLDGGYLEPVSRPRVSTNPAPVRDKSPSNTHKRTGSDAKTDKDEPIYDSPWGKRIRPQGPPPVSKKPPSNLASSTSSTINDGEIPGSSETTSSQAVPPSLPLSRSTPPTRPPPRPLQSPPPRPLQSPTPRLTSPGLPSPTPPPTFGNVRTKSLGSASSAEEDTPLSPKRHAPPPPPGSSSSVSKPVERVKSFERSQGTTSQTKNEAESLSADKVAGDMDFFSIEVIKVATSAMIGVSVKVKPLQTKPEVKQEVTAPFVIKVLPMGAVDTDGRIQPGDAIVEVNGRSLLQTPQDDAVHSINDTPGKSVRLKVGRPHVPISSRAPQSAIPHSTSSKPTLNDGDLSTSSQSKELESALSKLEELEVEKKQIVEDRDQARTEVDRLRDEMQELISENERVSTEALSKAEEAQARLSQELDSLQSELKVVLAVRDGEAAALASLEEKNAEVEELNSEVDSLKCLLEERKKTEEELQSKIVFLSLEKDRSSENMIEKEVNGGKNEEEEERNAEVLRKVQEQVETLKGDLAEKEGLLEEKDKKILELKKGLSGVLPQLQDAERGIAGYKEKLKQKEEAIEELVTKSKERQQRIEELEAEVKQFKDSSTTKQMAEDNEVGGSELQRSKYSPRKAKEPYVLDLEEQVEKLKSDLQEAQNRASKAESKLQTETAANDDDDVAVEKTVELSDDATEKIADVGEDFVLIGGSSDGEKESLVEESKRTASKPSSAKSSPLLPRAKVIKSDPDEPLQATSSSTSLPSVEGEGKPGEEDKVTEQPSQEETKGPPKPMPRPRKKLEPTLGDKKPLPARPRSQHELGEKDELEASLSRRCGSMSHVLDSSSTSGGSGEWVVVDKEEEPEPPPPPPNFDDFDAVSSVAVSVSTDLGREKARVGRRPRKSPSREHLKKMSVGGIGEELQPVKLTAIVEDPLTVPETRHSRNLSGSQNMGPPLVLPKPKPINRAKSAENLIDDDSPASTSRQPPTTAVTPTHAHPSKLPPGARMMVPILPASRPLKKAQSENSLDVDDVHLAVDDQPDGRVSGGSSPAKSRPGSSKGPAVGLSASTDSLDHLDGDSLGLPLFTVPDWSVDLVAQWMEAVGLGKLSPAIKEKGLSGKQLLDCDSGKIKGVEMTKEDISSLKKEVKTLKKLHEKSKKDEKKRIEAEKKEAKKKKK